LRTRTSSLALSSLLSRSFIACMSCAALSAIVPGPAPV
jgi:hypothetical protein